jgi:aminobenzoyl-glutamate utilization protein B
MVSQGQSSLAHAGMVRAARVLTATAIELVERPELIAKAKSELSQRRQGKPYQCPIPADVPLPFLRS